MSGLLRERPIARPPTPQSSISVASSHSLPPLTRVCYSNTRFIRVRSAITSTALPAVGLEVRPEDRLVVVRFFTGANTRSAGHLHLPVSPQRLCADAPLERCTTLLLRMATRASRFGRLSRSQKFIDLQLVRFRQSLQGGETKVRFPARFDGLVVFIGNTRKFGEFLLRQ